MNSRLIKLAEQRSALVARAASQRMDLAQTFAPWRGALSIADQGVSALRFVARHKALAVATLACAIALRPKLLSGWLHAEWLCKTWRIWRVALAVKRGLDG